ncbi:STAS domain-containing protein [Thermoleophilia bacterium SCSIO 60948]|nr:STAS domain-containing protein [Thermoleophilia bacterium SCSIO 60948]
MGRYPLVTASEIRTDRDPSGLAVIAVAGEHDLTTSEELKTQIETAIGAGEPVVVDLGSATFVDSSILATLVDGGRRAGSAGVGYALLIPPDAAAGVKRVVEVTGLHAAVEIATERDEAQRRVSVI